MRSNSVVRRRAPAASAGHVDEELPVARCAAAGSSTRPRSTSSSAARPRCRCVLAEPRAESTRRRAPCRSGRRERQTMHRAVLGSRRHGVVPRGAVRRRRDLTCHRPARASVMPTWPGCAGYVRVRSSSTRSRSPAIWRSAPRRCAWPPPAQRLQRGRRGARPRSGTPAGRRRPWLGEVELVRTIRSACQIVDPLIAAGSATLDVTLRAGPRGCRRPRRGSWHA